MIRRGMCKTCGKPVHERFDGRSGRFGRGVTVVHLRGHAPADGHKPDPVWPDSAPADPTAPVRRRRRPRGIDARRTCRGITVTELYPGYWAWECQWHDGRGAEGFATRQDAEWMAHCPGRPAPDYGHRLAYDET